jgi:hypothetical protein
MEKPRAQIIDTRSAFHDAIRASFAQAAEIGCLEIWLVDQNFADWPLGERAVIDNLTRWAQAHRRLTVLAHDFDEVVRRHPRWVAWRQMWSHVVQCRTNAELEAGEMPTLLLAPGLVTVRLVDPIHYRGSVSAVTADAVAARELVDAVLQRSEEAFPSTTLGL